MPKTRGWQRRFDDPIALPNGRRLVTLEDAALYIQMLPKKEQDLPHWQTAILTLINTAEGPDFSVSRQCRHASSPAPRQRSTSNSTTAQGHKGLQDRQMNRIG